MSRLSNMTVKVLGAAARHPEGRRHMTEPDPNRNRDTLQHTYQFKIEDDTPFYVEINKTEVKGHDGMSPLDNKGPDWNKISVAWTTKAVMEGILRDEKDLILEWHNGNWDFEFRESMSPYHSWLCMLLRCGKEQLAQEGLRAALQAA